MTAVPSSNRGRDAILLMPVVAMALVVLLLAVLLWLLHRSEIDDENRSLIQDVLWVEQNLHFTLDSDLERLVQLAEVVGREGASAAILEVQVHSIMANNPELERIILRDADGDALRALPPVEGDPGTGADPDWRDTMALARTMGREVYGSAYRLAEGRSVQFELQVPVFRGGTFAGVVEGIVSLDALLNHHVPWWFAQTYRLQVADGNGQVLAVRPQVEAPAGGLSHQLRFEPPGQGMTLEATVMRNDPHLVRNILAAAILALAFSAVFSLWALRRHARRRLEAEQALRSEHAFRKAMEDSLTVGMRARDMEGCITYVNPAFCAMVGWSAEELVGLRPPMPYWLPEELDRIYAVHRAVLRGDAPPEGFELTFRRRNGERFNALIYEAPLIDTDGVQSGWMASVLDVTERKRSEDMARQNQEKLQRTSRLITMGEMASTLAHELNQPLSAIASYAAGCLNRLGQPGLDAEDLRAPLSKLGVQAQRAGHIIRRIHDFVRKSDPLVAVCSLNQVVEDALGFLEAEARKRLIRVDLRLDPARPQVEADRILLEQVMLNLARNAMEAMGQPNAVGRLLRVTVDSGGGHARVTVADRGCGIAPEVAEGLFTPFFTTKDEGMGMGLNICRSIVESHRGRLWFEPNPGGGAVFAFSLPEIEQ